MKRCGFEVINNKYDTMEERVAESNEWDADLHVCIHTNAFNGVTSGTRIFASSMTSEGCKAAKAVFNVLAPKTPGTSESVSAYPTLYEIRMTTAPCVYVEAEFHDVPKIAQWIMENVVLIGEAIAEGICNYYDVAYVQPAGGNTIYRVQTGAFRVYENAQAHVAKLKADGYEAFIVEAKL